MSERQEATVGVYAAHREGPALVVVDGVLRLHLCVPGCLFHCVPAFLRPVSPSAVTDASTTRPQSGTISGPSDGITRTRYVARRFARGSCREQEGRAVTRPSTFSDRFEQVSEDPCGFVAAVPAAGLGLRVELEAERETLVRERNMAEEGRAILGRNLAEAQRERGVAVEALTGLLEAAPEPFDKGRVETWGGPRYRAAHAKAKAALAELGVGFVSKETPGEGGATPSADAPSVASDPGVNLRAGESPPPPNPDESPFDAPSYRPPIPSRGPHPAPDRRLRQVIRYFTLGARDQAGDTQRS